MHRILLHIIVVCVCFGVAFAEEQSAVQDTIVVTASREEEKASSIPAQVTVIDASEIEKSTAQNVPELLQQSGIHVSDIGGNQRNYQVDLRGFGEKGPANVLVLVDGRRINQPDLSNADWLLIPLERIGRIEIIKGGRGSVLYGDNASGGVINIITKQSTKTGAETRVSYGSYETYKLSAYGSLLTGRCALDLSAAYHDTEGYRDNSGIESKDFGLNLSYDPTDNLNLNVSGGYHTDSSGQPGALSESDFDQGADRTDAQYPYDFADTEDYYLMADMDFGMLTNDSFILETSARQRTKETISTFGSTIYEFKTETDTITLSPRFVFREDFGKIQNRISMGLDYSLAEERIDTFTGAGYDLDKKSTAYFLYDEFQPDEDVTLSGGYRNDRTHYQFAPNDPDNLLFKQEIWNLGMNYRFSPNAHVYGSYANSFRYPLLDELYNLISNSVNTNLREQTSTHYDLGGVYQTDNGWRFNLDLFQVLTKNELFYDPVNFSNTNLDGETRRTGFETGIKWQGTHLGAGVTYTNTRAKILDGAYNNRDVPDVAEHQGSAHVDYEFDSGLKLGLNANYTGERYFISDFDNSREKQEDYFLLNAKVSYPWRMLTFFVDLNNILDETYSAYGSNSTFGGGDTLAYYPSPKFNFLAGVKADF
ncbi:MAG: TonB-dependent receptor [Desulfobacteraceae bacterium]|nr:TonB-dependent receptor [Desulfobacteraceae bacterium]